MTPVGSLFIEIQSFTLIHAEMERRKSAILAVIMKVKVISDKP